MSVCLIGVGAMGEAILAGLASARPDPESIVIIDAHRDRGQAMASTYGVTLASDLQQAVTGVGCVVVAVKPHDVVTILESIAGQLAADTVVVSIAAGVTEQTLRDHLRADQPVVRVMPNTAALVGEAMSAMSSSGPGAAPALAKARVVLESIGRVIEVDEQQMDAVTALSGTGPAYVMYVAEAMIDAGVLLGLPRAQATELVSQTLFGSAKLLVQSGDHPTLLKERVTSPGGTTIAALATLEDRAVKAGIVAAVKACFQRSADMTTQPDPIRSDDSC